MTATPRPTAAGADGGRGPARGDEGWQPALLRPLLGGVLALAAALGIGRFAYTPILPAMQRATHFTTQQAGLLASANYAGYLAGALFAATITLGAARDRVLGLCLVTVILTTGSMAGTTDLVAWGIVRFLSGLASAGTFVLASGLVLEHLRQRRAASLSGWLYSGVGVGIAVSGTVVRVVDGALGWRGDWLALCLLAAALAALCWPLLPFSPPSILTAAPPPIAPDRGRQAAFVLLLLAYLLEGTGYIVTGTFLVTIVDAMSGLSATGPSIWIVVGLAAAPSCILWSRLADRIGSAPALILAYVTQACGIALPALAGGTAVALVAALLFGGTFTGIVTLTLTFAGDIAPQRSIRAIGWLTAAFGLGQIVGPALAGVLVGRVHSFGPALLAASAVVLVGGILIAALQRITPSRGGVAA